jgi:hypothetical protein
MVAGITIDIKLLKLNTSSGMSFNPTLRVNSEFDSNVTDESDLQFDKHSEPRISTFRGIKIDSSDDHENADDPIRFNSR